MSSVAGNHLRTCFISGSQTYLRRKGLLSLIQLRRLYDKYVSSADPRSYGLRPSSTTTRPLVGREWYVRCRGNQDGRLGDGPDTNTDVLVYLLYAFFLLVDLSLYRLHRPVLFADRLGEVFRALLYSLYVFVERLMLSLFV